MMGPEGKRLQIIMLDTRYFRSANQQVKVGKRKTYLPQIDSKTTMLGTAQWQWLAAELSKPADLRIIVSSIQVLATNHRFEKWENMPDEKERFIRLLRESKVGPTILLSGDRHLAEVCKMERIHSGLPFDLFEMTTSGMTHAGGPDDPSTFRIPGTYSRATNYGLIEIDWNGEKPALKLLVKKATGEIESSTVVGF